MTYCNGVRAGLPNTAEFSAGLGLSEAEKSLLSRCVTTYGNPRAHDEPFTNFDELVKARGPAVLQETKLMLTQRVATIFEAKVSNETTAHPERARVIIQSAELFGASILFLLISAHGFKNSVPTPFSFDIWQERNMGQTSYEMMQAKIIDKMHDQLRPHLQTTPPSEMEKFTATLLREVSV